MPKPHSNSAVSVLGSGQRDKSEYNENSNFYAHMALISERHVQGAFVGIPQDSRKNALRAGTLAAIASLRLATRSSQNATAGLVPSA